MPGGVGVASWAAGQPCRSWALLGVGLRYGRRRISYIRQRTVSWLVYFLRLPLRHGCERERFWECRGGQRPVLLVLVLLVLG
jgi:hypothetical protein